MLDNFLSFLFNIREARQESSLVSKFRILRIKKLTKAGFKSSLLSSPSVLIGDPSWLVSSVHKSRKSTLTK